MKRIFICIILFAFLATGIHAGNWGRTSERRVGARDWGRDAAEVVITPLNISGCVLWLEANFGVEGDSSGNPAGEDDPVFFWRDRSGEDNYAYQNADTSRPVFTPGKINARPAVKFDGNNDRMRMGNAALYSNTDGMTLIVVVEDSTTSNNKGILTKYHSTIEWWLYNYSFSAQEQNVYTPDNIAVGEFTQGVHLRWGEWKPGEYCRVYHNSTLQGSAAVPATDIDNTSQEVCIGSSGSIRYYTGSIAMALAYNHALTDAEKARLFNWYIKPRYGVP